MVNRKYLTKLHTMMGQYAILCEINLLLRFSTYSTAMGNYSITILSLFSSEVILGVFPKWAPKKIQVNFRKGLTV